MTEPDESVEYTVAAIERFVERVVTWLSPTPLPCRRAGGPRVCWGLLLVAGCQTPTQAVLEIHTDMPCDAFPTVAIGVGDSLENADTASAVANTCAEDGRVGTLVLVPSGSDDASFSVRVVAASCGRSPGECIAGTGGHGCVRADRLLSFVPGESLRVPIDLRQNCDGVTCGTGSTCVHGQCATLTRESSRCVNPSGCPDSTIWPDVGPRWQEPDPVMFCDHVAPPSRAGSCKVVRVLPSQQCDCGGSVEIPLTSDMKAAVRASQWHRDICACSDCALGCACQLQEVYPGDQASCASPAPNVEGWCIASSGAATGCEDGRPTLRFLGSALPPPASVILLMCEAGT